MSLTFREGKDLRTHWKFEIFINAMNWAATILLSLKCLFAIVRERILIDDTVKAPKTRFRNGKDNQPLIHKRKFRTIKNI